jgi:hypothetical protein
MKRDGNAQRVMAVAGIEPLSVSAAVAGTATLMSARIHCHEAANQRSNKCQHLQNKIYH